MIETYMAEQDKTELFETMPIGRALSKLAVPTVLSSLVMIIYNLADTYFVGMLNDPVQNSAVTLAAPVLLSFSAVTNLFGIGSSSMMSRALGLKDYDTVRKSSALGFYGALLAAFLYSLIFFIFRHPILNLLGADATTYAPTASYLIWTCGFGAIPAILNVVLSYLVRAEGSALAAGLGTMSGCFLNIILDPFFILPAYLDMGAAGAGLATLISNLAACVFFFLFLAVKKEKTYVSIKPEHLKAGRRLIRGIFAVGVPAAVQNLLNVTGMTVLNNFTSAYGTTALAGMGIAAKIDKVAFFIALGTAQGMMPLVGYNFAAKNEKRMREAIRVTMAAALVFLSAMTVFYLTAARGIIRFFMKDSDVIAWGSRYLKGLSLALPFLGIDFIGVGVFQACGMGKNSLLFAVLRKIILEIPALIILNHFFPPYGIAYAQFAAELILAAAAGIVLHELLKRIRRAQAERENKRAER